MSDHIKSDSKHNYLVRTDPEKEISRVRRLYVDGFEERERSSFFHIMNNFSLSRYVRHAGVVQTYLKNGSVLDWGASLGQMSILLRDFDYKVTAYDINISKATKKILKSNGIPCKVGLDKLPFRNQSFDAVLSCGVLEHVKDDDFSVHEIHRILKKNGFFFIFNLPNRYSISEYIARKMPGIYRHDRLYNKSDISRLLEHKFDILRISPSHLIPSTSARIRALRWFSELTDRYWRITSSLDIALEDTPLLNKISNEWLVVARKR